MYLSIELLMPDDFEDDEVRGTASYYWSEELDPHFVFSQSGQTFSLNQGQKPIISGDGKSATYTFTLSTQKMDLSKPFELSVSVWKKGVEDPMQTGLAWFIEPKGLGGILPYDLLKHMPLPLGFKGTLTWTKNRKPDQVTLTPKGRLFFVQVRDAKELSSEVPAYLRLKSPDRIFGKGGEALPHLDSSETKSRASSEDLFLSIRHAAEKESPYRTFLLWLPTEKADFALSAEALYDHSPAIASVGQKAFAASDKVIAIDLKKDGTQISNVPFLAPADERKGGDPFFTMEDIDFWVGKGAKRAALVIEFHLKEGEDAYVWGYRFDGDKTGFDMLSEIVRTDPRLSILTAPGGKIGGVVLGAVAYQTGEVSVPKPPFVLDGKGVPSDGKGVTAVNIKPDFDLYGFQDLDALFRAGWKTKGYWSYFTKDKRLSSWNYSPTGVASRVLQNGSWDGWSYQIGFGSMSGNALGSKFIPAVAPK